MKLAIERIGRHWFVWTVPEHRIISRAFLQRGEAEAELARREEFARREAEVQAARARFTHDYRKRGRGWDGDDFG